jgi:ABC-type branched-subunit amino acid transport system substrate-binding protein
MIIRRSRRTRLRVGLAANLLPGGSLHRAAFERAVAAARDDISLGHRLELVIENDCASYEGGVAAAERLLAAEVVAVVGHFASAAAHGARPVYARAAVPLMLPAATAQDLVGAGPVFRLCSPDGALAAALVEDLPRATQRIVVLDDGSRHGVAMARAVAAASMERGLHVTGDPARADVVVHAGMMDGCGCRVRELRAAGYQGLIVLGDDAVHPELPRALGRHTAGVRVYGFPPAAAYEHAVLERRAHWARHGGEPGTYFLETYAGLQIAAQLAAAGVSAPFEISEALETGPFWTVLGRVAFHRGEGGTARYARYVIADDRLIAERMVRAPSWPAAEVGRARANQLSGKAS